MIKVSVILPSLNVFPYIEECLRSVMSQTLPEIEIIAVDAGSADGTMDVIQKLAAADARIRIIPSPVKSYGYQVNLGIRHARGEYIGVAETDDYVDSRMYEDLYAKAKRHNLDVIWANYDAFSENAAGERVFQTYSSWPENPENFNCLFTAEDLKKMTYDGSNYWKGIFSRDFLLKNRIVFNETPGAAFQDMGFFYRLLMRAGRLMFVPESYYRYRYDREESSVHSPNGLQNALHEHSFYLQNNELKPGFEALFYRRMANIFLWLLNFREKGKFYTGKIDFAWLKNNAAAYSWFLDALRNAERDGYFTEESGGNFWRSYKKLPLTLFGHALPELNARTANFSKDLTDRRVVLCGGKPDMLVKLARELFLDIAGICTADTEESGHGSFEHGSYNILSCQEAVLLPEDHVFIIADKEEPDIIKTRLLGLGIEESRLIICPQHVFYPSVSVIVPVLNTKDIPEYGIKSLLAQKLPDMEIVLAAASEACKHELAQKYAHNDERIKIVQASSKNYGALICQGAASASGEYVAVCSPHDYTNEYMYRDLYKIAKMHDLDAACCNYTSFEEKNDEDNRWWFFLLQERPDLYEKLLAEDELKAAALQLPAGAGIVRRKIFLANAADFCGLQEKISLDIRFGRMAVLAAKRAMCLPAFHYHRKREQELPSGAKDRLSALYLKYSALVCAGEIKKIFKNRFYTAMAAGCLNALDICRTEADRNWIEENERAYQWLRNRLLENIDLVDGYWQERAAAMPPALLDFLLEYYPSSMREFLRGSPCPRLIFFGAGRRGAGLYESVPHPFAPIDAFSDNNESIWHSAVNGLQVLPPAFCVKKYPDHAYLITVKNRPEEIRQQLLSLGVDSGHIFVMDN